MRYFKYLVLAFLITIPVNVFAGDFPAIQSNVTFLTTDRPDEEAYAYYDLRNRKSYIQVTHVDDVRNPLCIHVQIFQQDRSCDELNFEDELTPNDTVVYDLDNIIKNDGSEAPINLADDSYGFVAISSFVCGDRDSDGNNDLIGNFRIIDDSGYEYRMNLIMDKRSKTILPPIVPTIFEPIDTVTAHVVIPFNTVDGANQADIVGFVVDNDRLGNGQEGKDDDYNVYNEEAGITFDVFQFDENEEPLSCDKVTFACAPDKAMHYGINDDYPASRGDNLLCEGGGLKPGQTNGYISLENPTFLSPLELVDRIEDDFEFICLVGLNNGNGTG
ncbi:MAG: hypothetical protein GTO02_19860, partial [Candidatus Dadabacteria bacterium]|nr:hypothetical protein [Candidatus Dadabacteria bacterium]NIQ16557.1 hypothetical protein [Candidatus Dadabacteria bacterium]